MGKVEITTLGGLRIAADGRPVRLPTAKHCALLTYFAVHSGKPLRRDALAALLWPRSGEAHARHSLSQTLYGLRRSLPALEFGRGKETLELAPRTVDLDTERLARALERGELDEAARLWRGDFLDGFQLADSPAFERWQESQQMELHRRTGAVLRLLLGKRADDGDWYAAERAAALLLVLEPLDQDVHGLRIRAIAASGDMARAREAYRSATTLLRERGHGYPDADFIALESKLTGPASPAISPASPGPAAPFVGRAAELKLLRRHWELARHGTRAAVAVLGEAGIGKTRLCQQFLRECRLEGARVIGCRAHSTEQWLAYAAIADGLAAELTPQDLQELPPVWAAAVAQLVPELEPARPRPALALPALDQEAARRRLHEGVTRAIHQLCDRGPVVLHIDDFQWADRSTTTLVHYLIRRSPEQRLLFLFALRPEDVVPGSYLDRLLDECVERDWLSPLRLAALHSAESGELIARFCEGTELRLGSTDRAQLGERLGGHPFFLVETLKALLDPPAARSTTRPRSGAGPPLLLAESVEALLRLRLKQLSPAARDVASALAVLGGAAPQAWAQQVTGLGDDRFIAAVESLLGRGLCTEHHGSLQFAHDLIREAVYRQLSSVRRRVLHRAAADVLRQADASASAIAEHYAAAGEGLAAYENALRAAAESEAVYAYQEMEHHLRLALRHSPTAKATLATRRRLAALLARLQRFSEAAALYEELRQELERTGQEAELLDVRTRLLDAREKIGLQDRAAAHEELRQLRGEAERQRDPARLLEVLRLAVRYANNAGAGEEATALIGLLQQLGEADAPEQVQASALMLAAQQLSMYLSADAGADHAERALALAERHGAVEGVINALHVAGIASYSRGALNAALAYYDRALALVEDSGAVEYNARILNQRAVVLQEQGQYEPARQSFRRILELAEQTDSPRDAVIAHSNLSIIALALGEFAEAERLCGLILERGDQPTTWWSAPAAYGVLGTCALETGRLARARECRDSMLDAMGGRNFWFGDFSVPEIFLARLGWIEGRRPQALERLETVIEAYRQRDFFCRSRMELQLAKFLLRSDRARAAEIGQRILAAAAAAGARPLADEAESVLDALRFRRGE